MSYDSPISALLGTSRPHKTLATPLTRPVRTSWLNGEEEEDATADPTLAIIHDLLLTNIEATKVQQQVNKDNTEVERPRIFLKELN